jgi:Domain of unknown function (DUF4390)
MTVLAAIAWAPAALRADPAPSEVAALRLERQDDGLYLNTSVSFELAAPIEDALLKGIPMFFVAEADVYRDRWYWTDRKVASVSRYIRLAYQPLTRRWRVNAAPTPGGTSGLGVALTQHFDTLPEAVASVRRITRWKIADAADIDAEARHNVEFRFRLDITQLPRPFQIGVVGQGEWNISVSRSQRLENGR